MELFKYEFRRSLKKPVTILIIAVIFFLGISMFSEMKYFNDKIKYNKDIMFCNYNAGLGIETNKFLIEMYSDEGKLNMVNLLNNMSTYAQMGVENYEAGNFQEAYKNELIVSMLNARWGCGDNEKSIKFLRDNIIEIWDELLPEMKYDDLNALESDFNTGELFTKREIIDIKYKYDLYRKNIRYVDNSSLNNVTFTYNMIDKYLPFILALFIALTTFNCVSDEYRNGVVKNIVTQGMKRSRYYLTMIFANFLSAVIVITSTLVILNLIVGFLAGFQSFDTPILSNANQWNSITTKAMDLEKSYLKNSTRLYLGPTEVNYEDLALNSFEDYKFITFKIFVIEAAGIYLLFAFFLTGFSVFISSIFADKIKALMVLVLIIGIGYFTAYTSPSIFNVFSTLRVTQIITGSLNLTLLGSFIVLGISILITVFLGITYFRRKDITY